MSAVTISTTEHGVPRYSRKSHRHRDLACQNTHPRTGTAEEGSTSAIRLALVSALTERSSSSRTLASRVLRTATLPSSLPPSPAPPPLPLPPLREATRSIAPPFSAAVPPPAAPLLVEVEVSGEFAGRTREDRRGAEDAKRPILSRSSADASSCRASNILQQKKIAPVRARTSPSTPHADRENATWPLAGMFLHGYAISAAGSQTALR